MGNHSIIEHRSTYHYVKLEEDYLAICCTGESSPHCKALILSILEQWITTKRERNQGEYVYLTMPQWIQHTYMLYERNVITACIHELLKDNLIVRRPIVMYGQKTFEYALNITLLHELIKKLPVKEPGNNMPNLDAYKALKERDKKERAAKKEANKKEVREKSPTGYVKNQRNITSINITSNITSEEEGEHFQNDEEISSSLSENFVKSEDQIFQWWDEINEKKTSRSPKQKETAQFLAEKQVTKQDLLDQKAWCWNNDPAWHEKNGLQLSYLQHTWDAWQQSKAHQIAPECDFGPVVQVEGPVTAEAVATVLQSSFLGQKHAGFITDIANEVVYESQSAGLYMMDEIHEALVEAIARAARADDIRQVGTVIGQFTKLVKQPQQGQQQRLA